MARPGDGAADCRISGNAGIIKKTKKYFRGFFGWKIPRKYFFIALPLMEPDDQAAVLTKLFFRTFCYVPFFTDPELFENAADGVVELRL